MTSTEFHGIRYEPIYSNDDDDDNDLCEEDEVNELPPAVVLTTEKTGQWNHIENLDDFFIRIYNYHKEQGFSCLFLSSFFELVQYVFVVLFATFLTVCIDYKQLFDEKEPSFSKVIDWKKVEDMPSSLVICLVVAFLFWAVRLAKVVHNTFKAWQMRNFYHHILHITDSELQNMQWCDVQKRLMEVQQVHQISIHKKELSELDIHHRILRQKNYFIALQNKGVIPFVFNFPLFGKRTFLTEGLKYNLNFLLFKGPGAPFGNKWKLKSDYKEYGRRSALAGALSRRIFFLGLANLLFCPFILIYQILISFFTYAEMIKRSPDAFGARRWSQYGRLYLRHFNELDHEFQSRLNKAYEPAVKYMNAFSSPLFVILVRNVAFFAGALLAVLLALGLYDSDVLAAEHVVLFIAVLGIIVKICTGFIPDENTVFNPASLMKMILSHTHYIPDEWKGKAHTTEVREEFSKLFQYKFVHLLEELASPLLTPLILCFAIRTKSQQIIDFYRNFTVEVTGVGDVCSFAQMDVRRHGNKGWFDAVNMTQPTASEEEQAENGKTELSLLHFSMKNPTWNPTNSGKQFIETIKEHAIQESLSMSHTLATHGIISAYPASMASAYPNSQDDLGRLMSLQSLAQPPVGTDVDLQLQETILNSSMLYMHGMHDKHNSIVSPTDISGNNMGISHRDNMDISRDTMGISHRDDGEPKMCQTLPLLDEPVTELKDFPYTTEQGGGSWQENT